MNYGIYLIGTNNYISGATSASGRPSPTSLLSLNRWNKRLPWELTLVIQADFIRENLYEHNRATSILLWLTI